jgi:hypothetical protein
MIRKVTLGLLASLASVFLVASPALASSSQPSQPWDPIAEKPTTGVYIDPKVDEDTRNVVQSAYEATLEGTESTRYTYAARVPETWDIQSATRKVAETWGLDRNKESILFYDTQAKRVFIWPATTANTEAIASLPKIVEPEAFSKAFPTLYGDAIEQAQAEKEAEDIKSTTDLASSILLNLWPIAALLFGACICIAAVKHLSYY